MTRCDLTSVSSECLSDKVGEAAIVNSVTTAHAIRIQLLRELTRPSRQVFQVSSTVNGHSQGGQAFRACRSPSKRYDNGA